MTHCWPKTTLLTLADQAPTYPHQQLWLEVPLCWHCCCCCWRCCCRWGRRERKGQSLLPRCQLFFFYIFSFLYFLSYSFFAASWWWLRDMRVAATRVVLITRMSLTIMKTSTTYAIQIHVLVFMIWTIWTNLLSENLLRWPESSQLEKPPSQ